MPIRPGSKSRFVLFLAGMATLLSANLMHFFSRPETAPWTSGNDAIVGVLYGITFGLLLLSLRAPRAVC